MGIELLMGVVATVASVAGVWVGYMQYKHQKEEAEHLRSLVIDKAINSSPPDEELAKSAAAQQGVSVASAKANPMPAPPPAPPPAPVPEVPAALPVPKNPTAGMEAALIVAREMSAPYDRDKKRCEIFDEALRRRQFAFAATVIVDFENAYDRERCKEALAGSMTRVNNPALALEVARILSGKQ